MIPPEWRKALDDNPRDYTVRLALADWFEEQGDSRAAEALRWSVEKRVSPVVEESGVGWWRLISFPHGHLIRCPPGHYDVGPNHRSPPWKAFWRLIYTWQVCDTAVWWQWENPLPDDPTYFGVGAGLVAAVAAPKGD